MSNYFIIKKNTSSILEKKIKVAFQQYVYIVKIKSVYIKGEIYYFIEFLPEEFPKVMILTDGIEFEKINVIVSVIKKNEIMHLLKKNILDQNDCLFNYKLALSKMRYRIKKSFKKFLSYEYKRTVRLENIKNTIKIEHIQKLFKNIGLPLSIKFSCRSQISFAYIQFGTEKAVNKSLSLQNTILQGSRIKISKALDINLKKNSEIKLSDKKRSAFKESYKVQNNFLKTNKNEILEAKMLWDGFQWYNKNDGIPSKMSYKKYYAKQD